MARLTDEVVAYVLDFNAHRKDAPAADFEGVDELIAQVRGPAPGEGRPLSAVMPLIAAAMSKGHDTTGDGWLAYIPGGGLYTAALGDFIARVTNRFVGVWEPAPVAAEIEATVLRWLCDLFGYPTAARGVLTTGGSIATLAAFVAARHARLGDSFQDGVIYITSETHSASAKAAIIAGFPRDRIRIVPTTTGMQMDLAELARMVGSDRAAGLRPFLVVASAGTTNTGAVDDIASIADMARAEGLWLHVDAAYGGFFQLTDHGRALFAGVERADSIVLDPHKGLFLPYGTGAVLVREGQALRAAHEIHGPFLQDLAPESDIPNFSDYSPELSRDARGLRVWLPLMLHGLDAFRDALDEKLALARALHAELRDTPGLDVPWEPQLSTLGFRASNVDAVRADALTRELLLRINASGRVFLSSTVVEQRTTIRVCILSVHTHRDRIDELVRIVRGAIVDVA